MKKIFLFLALIFAQIAFARDIYPVYLNSYTHFGTGIISIKNEVKIYEAMDEKSPVKAILNKNGIKGNNKDEAFLVSKGGDIRYLSVEADEDEWYLICYNQSKRLFGWLKKADEIDFMTLDQFYNFFGRKNGIYIFRNLPDPKKKLYSAPDEESTVVDKFSYPKHVSLWLLSGDWMLVKVTTYDGVTKTGWFRYRLEDNGIAAFPDFSE